MTTHVTKYITGHWSCTEDCGYDKSAVIKLPIDPAGRMTEDQIAGRQVPKLIESFKYDKQSVEHWLKHPVTFDYKVESI